MTERPQDCPSRIAIGLGSGFAAGALLGAVKSNWGDVPVVLRDKPWPALVRTGSVMTQFGTTLGLVGLTYSAVEVRGLGSAAPAALHLTLCPPPPNPRQPFEKSWLPWARGL